MGTRSGHTGSQTASRQALRSVPVWVLMNSWLTSCALRADVSAMFPVMACSTGTSPACAAMGRTERHVAGSFGLADGTCGGTNGIVAKRGTIHALTAFLEIGAHGIHCGTRVTQVTVAFRVDAHIVILRADVTAEVNGIEVACHPDGCRLLLENAWCSGSSSNLHQCLLNNGYEKRPLIQLDQRSLGRKYDWRYLGR